jgi:hypothetical protein
MRQVTRGLEDYYLSMRSIQLVAFDQFDAQDCPIIRCQGKNISTSRAPRRHCADTEVQIRQGSAAMSEYRALDPAKIIETLERLSARITARFPQAGLGRVCAQATETARLTPPRVEAIAKPDWRLRMAFYGLAAAGLTVLLTIGVRINYSQGADNIYSVLQGVDSGFNMIVLFGAAILGVARYEESAKRRTALKDLHELRSLMHIIDMHQLTKDPSAGVQAGSATAASPDHRLTPFELSRYLDYCSELLSLTAKIAALYAQSSRDSVVIGTVNDLEQLAANLSEKIWQKIGLIRVDRKGKPEPEFTKG